MKKTVCLLSLMGVMSFIFMINTSLYASTTDDRIESSAKETYVFKTYLKDDNIAVSSKDGNVILTGTVAEEPHLSLAKDTVASLPGVKSVDSQLTVKADAPRAGSDAWLITKVKFTLLIHKNVNVGTNVTAENGVVTLRGMAASLAQKDLTTAYAADVEGVTSVINEMTAPAEVSQEKSTPATRMEAINESVDDASITALVKGTLLYHRSTSALRTNVQTNGGVVTLSGEAKTEAEKDLAGKLVSDVHGVNKVVNNINVI